MYCPLMFDKLIQTNRESKANPSSELIFKFFLLTILTIYLFVILTETGRNHHDHRVKSRLCFLSNSVEYQFVGNEKSILLCETLGEEIFIDNPRVNNIEL